MIKIEEKEFKIVFDDLPNDIKHRIKQLTEGKLNQSIGKISVELIVRGKIKGK